MSHTPGPWVANLDSDHGDYVLWGPGDDEFVANVGTEPEANRIIAFDVSEANARLIAAAPELLDACDTARGAVFALVEMLTAEMTGDPNRDLRHLNCEALAGVAKILTAAIAKAEGR